MTAPLAARPFWPKDVPRREGSNYPTPLKTQIKQREKWVLGEAASLTNFGVNLTRLPPGEISSQRHWHSAQDEFVWLLEGELTLITDRGEERFVAGQCIGFPAGLANGHQLVNRGSLDALYLEVGDRQGPDVVTYPDVDMRQESQDGNDYAITRKDGSAY